MESVLVLLACLATDCQPFVLSEVVPQAECMSLSQPMAAKWAGDHPQYTIRKIICADPRELAAFLGRTQA